MQNDYIDWCIVDALVRYEWAAYYHSITDRTPALLSGEADFKWVVRTFYAIFYSVCFGLSLWGVQNLYAVRSPWATPAAWFFALVSTWEVITIIRGGRRRRRARAKDTELQTRLLMAMHDTCRLFRWHRTFADQGARCDAVSQRQGRRLLASGVADHRRRSRAGPACVEGLAT